MADWVAILYYNNAWAFIYRPCTLQRKLAHWQGWKELWNKEKTYRAVE